MSDFEAYDAFTNGRSLLASRDFHQAAIALERAKRLEPEQASIREALGRAYMGAYNFSRARDEFAVAVELDPTDGYAHFGLGKAYERLREPRKAAHHLRLARVYRIGLHPSGHESSLGDMQAP